MISNDNKLRNSVAIINEQIQKIQDYLGQDSHADGKIRFSRDFMNIGTDLFLISPIIKAKLTKNESVPNFFF